MKESVDMFQERNALGKRRRNRKNPEQTVNISISLTRGQLLLIEQIVKGEIDSAPGVASTSELIRRALDYYIGSFNLNRK